MSGRNIEADDWHKTVQCQHQLHQRHGTRAIIYQCEDSPFATTSLTATTVDDNDADNPLTLHQGVIRLTREMVDAGSIKHELTVRCVGKDIDVNVSVFEVDSGSLVALGTFTVSRASTTVDTFENSILITEAAADEGAVLDQPPRTLLVAISANAISTSAELYQAIAYETYITGVQLPTE